MHSLLWTSVQMGYAVCRSPSFMLSERLLTARPPPPATAERWLLVWCAVLRRDGVLAAMRCAVLCPSHRKACTDLLSLIAGWICGSCAARLLSTMQCMSGQPCIALRHTRATDTAGRPTHPLALRAWPACGAASAREHCGIPLVSSCSCTARLRILPAVATAWMMQSCARASWH